MYFSDENYARREFDEADNEIYDGQQFRSEKLQTQGDVCLSYPIVIPQRRLENRSRGFPRVYAPALEGCGIGQETFLSFIESLNRETQVCSVHLNPGGEFCSINNRRVLTFG